MKRLMRTVIELVAPTSIHYPEVPPMELGMTPNDHLQDAAPVNWVDEAESTMWSPWTAAWLWPRDRQSCAGPVMPQSSGLRCRGA